MQAAAVLETQENPIMARLNNTHSPAPDSVFAIADSRAATAAEREAIDPHAHFGQCSDGGADVDRITSQAVELCHDQNVAGFQLVHESGKAAALRDGGAAGNRLGDDPARFDLEAGGFDFLNLVLGRLAGRGDADIGAPWAFLH